MFAIAAALIKYLPTFERLVDVAVAYYENVKKERNQRATDGFADRDAAAIAGARAGLPKLCAGCPYAGGGAGRDGGATAAPPV